MCRKQPDFWAKESASATTLPFCERNTSIRPFGHLPYRILQVPSTIMWARHHILMTAIILRVASSSFLIFFLLLQPCQGPHYAHQSYVNEHVSISLWGLLVTCPVLGLAGPGWVAPPLQIYSGLF